MTLQEINSSESFDYTYSLESDKDEENNQGMPVLNNFKNGLGKKFEPHERDVAAARHVKVGSINKYYIKMDASGEIFDPTDDTHRTASANKRNGNPIFYMSQVKKDQFSLYLHFLKTKDKRYLMQARRIF